jgi:hypothetical protein
VTGIHSRCCVTIGKMSECMTRWQERNAKRAEYIVKEFDIKKDKRNW